MNIESIKYMVMAQDMDRAIGFYRDVIGMKVNSESPFWSEMSFGDVIVALHGGGSGQPNKTGLSIQVSDIDAACKEVEAGGGKVLSGPEVRQGEGIKLAELADTENNLFSIAEQTG